MKETAENVKEGFICPNPAAIHRDGEIMNDLKNQYKCEDRVPILISGRGNFKLLGAPALPVKSSERAGDLISNSVMNLLKDWNYDWKISSMVFDTTAANTGHLTAACISIQSKLDRALLWCACRRHIGELVINGAWEALGVETSSSPDIKIFKRFRKNGFAATSHAASPDRKLQTFEVKGEFDNMQKDNTLGLIKATREAKVYDRCDYKEV